MRTTPALTIAGTITTCLPVASTDIDRTAREQCLRVVVAAGGLPSARALFSRRLHLAALSHPAHPAKLVSQFLVCKPGGGGIRPQQSGRATMHLHHPRLHGVG